MTTALPAKRVDLATEQTFSASDARLFVCTASGNAQLNCLHAATSIAETNRLANFGWRGRWAANGRWCFTANRSRSWCLAADRGWSRSFAASGLRCTAGLTAIFLAKQPSGCGGDEGCQQAGGQSTQYNFSEHFSNSSVKRNCFGESAIIAPQKKRGTSIPTLCR